MKKSNLVTKSLVAATLLASGSAAFADGVNLTPVTGAFVASDIVTGVMAIATTLAVVYVSIKGVKIVLGMLRGG